jgi:hypothetical protein
MDFQTSVRKQLSDPGVLKAFQSAKSVAVQLISSPDDQNVTDEHGIHEDIIHAESDRIVLNAKQRDLLLETFLEDTTYEESWATCLCFFTPQLRVLFDDSATKSHLEIFLNGVSHGEIRAFRDGNEIAFTRSWRFIPRYLILMDRLFPDHSITKMLHEYHQNRMKSLANHAPDPTPVTVTPAADAPVAPAIGRGSS